MIRSLLGLLGGVPWWAWLVGAVVAAAGGRLAYLESKLDDVETEADSLALELDGKEALQDSTRELTDLVEELGGVVRLFQRRSFQAELQVDELDRRLGQESRARITAEARLQELEARGTGTVAVDTVTGARSARFHVREEPYTITADVHLPVPPAEGILDARVQVDPAEISARIGCEEDRGQRIRSASVLFQTPPWLEIELTDVRQEPDVCNPRLARPDPGFDFWGHLPGPAGGALAGWAVGGAPRDAAIGGGIGLAVQEAIHFLLPDG